MHKINPYKYSSTYGISTKFWGPAAWRFLFSSVMGGYPPILDKRKKEHKKIEKEYISMFRSLRYTLACGFCRTSYTQFIKELPITDFTGSRIEMMYWLYLVRDRVNKKLINQEIEEYKKAVDKLKNPTKSELKRLKREILITEPSPSFKSVLNFYESHRS
jgi:hypothetical protein